MSSVAQPTAPTAEPSEESFDVLEYVVEGNTVLPVIEVERAIYKYLGEKRSIKDVEAARKSLENVYQSRGFQTVFVDIPEQRIADGVVRLRVIEGAVERSVVTGTRYFLASEIRSTASEFKPGNVPNLERAQQQVSQLNRTADRQVTPVLKPGRTPGTVEVELNVKDRLPLHADLELNDRQTPFTTRSRALGTVRYDNLWQRQHSIGLTYQTSPEDTKEVDVLSLSYLWRFREASDVVALYAVDSDSDVAVVGSSTVFGKATIAGVRWIHPLPGSARYFHSTTLGVDYKDFDQTNIGEQTATVDVLPAITYVPLTAGYSGTVSFPSNTTQFSVNFSTAPRNLLGNRDSEFAGRRVLARAGYYSFKYDLSDEFRFAERWGAYGKIGGQWTAVPLVANEQLSVGGVETVRGYFEAELVGDRGTYGQFELRFHPWGRVGQGWREGLSTLAFADFGTVSIVEPLGPQFTQRSISSVGLGIRFAWRGWRAATFLGHALRDGSLGVGSFLTEKGSNRWHLLLGYEL